MKRAVIVLTLIAAVAVPAATAVDRSSENRGKDCRALNETRRVETSAVRYLTNWKRRHDHCISAKANARSRQRAAACKKLRSVDVGMFQKRYNSVGRCVNAKKAEARATSACKKQRSENGVAFEDTYETFEGCVEAEMAKAKARARAMCKKVRANDPAKHRSVETRGRCLKTQTAKNAT